MVTCCEVSKSLPWVSNLWPADCMYPRCSYVAMNVTQHKIINVLKMVCVCVCLNYVVLEFELCRGKLVIMAKHWTYLVLADPVCNLPRYLWNHTSSSGPSSHAQFLSLPVFLQHLWGLWDGTLYVPHLPTLSWLHSSVPWQLGFSTLLEVSRIPWYELNALLVLHSALNDGLDWFMELDPRTAEC